ncbi:MAG: outer membrane lipoprotein carrier protein LolA, partial [Deltaproteobacteria bacterium]|nr:outer membrane lipoprotein carrier protein LolA [Deltaproteobacteria bacterium]
MPQAQKGQGTLSFKKPDRMLWDYEAPERQQFILDGNNLWVYLPGEKQVMKNNYAVIPSHVVLDLFRGTVDLNKEFVISFVSQKEPPKTQEVVLELVPKVYNPSIRRLTLMLDQKLCTISRSTLEDDFGTVTVMHFSDFAIDAGLADKQFKFVPPAGVDVFELPKPPVSK